MPFHQFNQLTGRLKESTQLNPFSPIPPVPLQSSEPPKMFFDTVKTKPVQTETATAHKSTLPLKMEKMYKFFQADVHRPVYRYCGKKDSILFGITATLVFASFARSLKFIVDEANK
ncbi:hypothetical protein KM043_002661 [Ampulex compressa]|nr:hypothetical protein KM043_002661 [Ampulex compressa]